jgi:hypothetical protein
LQESGDFRCRRFGHIASGPGLRLYPFGLQDFFARVCGRGYHNRPAPFTPPTHQIRTALSFSKPFSAFTH